MPVTTYHFGPAVFLHSLAPRHISFLAFCGVNVLIDCESLYNLIAGNDPVHAFFHTYVGGTLIIAAAVACFAGLRSLARRWPLPDWFQWQGLTLLPVTLGAAAGIYSHLLLDSLMHWDMRPYAPFTQANPWIGWIPTGTLHAVCVGAGILGWLLINLQKLQAARRDAAPLARSPGNS